MKFGEGLTTKILIVFMAMVSFSMVLSGGVLAAHDTTVTIDPTIASCEQISQEYTVSITNNVGSADSIREVRLYDDSLNDGYRDAGIVDFQCGDPPTGWTVDDRLALYHYCQYETSIIEPYMIDPSETEIFTFSATLDDTNQECGNQFKVATIDDVSPVGQVVFKFPFVDVDCNDPVINKELREPTGAPGYGIGECPPELQGPGGECWITRDECVYFESYDTQDNCDLGLDHCDWSYTVDGMPHDSGVAYPGSGGMANYLVCFDEDSVHVLNITCYDIAGNVIEDIETFRVDSNHPNTTKVISEPKKIDGHVEWVDSVTEITMTAIDPDPTTYECNIGVDKTWYRNDLEDNWDVCWHPEDYCNSNLGRVTPYDQEAYPGCIDFWQVTCEDDGYWSMHGYSSWEDCVETNVHGPWDPPSMLGCMVDPEWKLYKGVPINKDEESCHVLKYFSIDDLGNMEPMNYNCFFVDKTPPEVFKDNGDAIFDCGEPAFMENDGCFHWITTSMPVEFDCVDPEPHPAGDEELCFKVSYDYVEIDEGVYDWGYITGEYCSGPLNGEGYCCVDVSEDAVYDFYFQEESMHNLEYYCIDAVEKKSDEHIQYYKVDDTPPSILKTMIGDDHLGECPPGPSPLEPCYVADNGENGVRVDVTDGGPICAVDNTVCTYELVWEATANECAGRPYEEGMCLVDSGQFGEEGVSIIFHEDSRHLLIIECEDALGNMMVPDIEEFLVDSTPPETLKEYGEPQKVEPGCLAWAEDMCLSYPVGLYDSYDECVADLTHSMCTWWITSETPITLTAEDEKVGVDKIYWRNLWFPENSEICDRPGIQVGSGTTEFCEGECPPPVMDFCHPEYYMGQPYVATPVEGFNEYDGPFVKPEESCHVIEYYSVDRLGNQKEIVDWQCVYVDNTAPLSVKTVGEPKVAGDYGLDWYITQDTSITLDCEDRMPHPVGQETMCFKVSYEGDEYVIENGEVVYLTDQYCPTDLNDEEYCCVYVGEDYPDVEIEFQEDSIHNLEYYCVDHLGNDERDYNMEYPPEHALTDDYAWIQWYAVETVPPIINKTIVGPHIECPDIIITGGPGIPQDCFLIDGVTTINVDTYDPEPHPVNQVVCEWGYWWLDQYYGPFIEDAFPFVISDWDESEHILEIECWDALGNTVNDVEMFLVDKTPPGIHKEYGDPYREYHYESYWAKWISSETNVHIWVTDDGPHQSGIKEVEYRVSLLDDNEYCYNRVDDAVLCENAVGSGEWTTIDPADYDGFDFNIPEDSCHLIEIVATDNVEKVNDHKQCVFVDNQGPEPNKTVGEPKSPWDAIDPPSYFYPEIVDMCWSDNEEMFIECWKVTMATPIEMECEDVDPHPVDHGHYCFKVEMDAEDVTDRYCEWYQGEFNDTGDGYCCMTEEIKITECEEGDLECRGRKFYFLEETEHNLKYYCVDALGNVGPIDDEKFKVEGTKFEVPLFKKWNLISVPFVLLDDAPEEVFKDLEGVHSVWTYDPETCTDPSGWCVWTPGEAPDTLTSISPGWGYWVLETLDETEHEQGWASEWITIGGSLFSPNELPPSRDLQPGWNLIGYYGTSWELYPWGDANFVCGDAFDMPDRYIYGDKVYCSLNSLIDTQEGFPRWSSLWSFVNCGDHNAFWLGLNTCADGSPQQFLDRMYAGRGYWLEMDVEDMYAPATNCVWNSDFECKWTGGGILP
jgi:hypothetical protein